MTPEAQQIAIAEACRFKRWHMKGPNYVVLCDPSFEQSDRWAGEGDEITTLPVTHISPSVPAYLADLNAIHCAEMHHFDMLVAKKHWMTLSDVMGNGLQVGHWSATAAQRAEAFLKTLDLWTE